MPRGYRCFLAAVVGWLALAAAQQPAKQQQGTAGANKATNAQPAVPPPPPYAAHPDKYAEACYRAKDHDAADLCAQWRAALATEKAAHEARRATTWAIIAALLSAATVVGLIVTIWQTFGALGEARRGNRIAQRANARTTRQSINAAADTKEALRVARRNANAAHSLAKNSQKAARIQLRPYLTVRGIEIEKPYLKPEGRVCDIGVKIVNNGQTPARLTQFYVQVLWHANDLFTTLLEVEKTTKFRVHKGKDPTNLAMFIAAHGAGLADPGQLLAFVRIDYSDVFDEEYTEIFCFQLGNRQGSFSQLGLPTWMNHMPVPDYLDVLGVDENGEPKDKGKPKEA